MFPGLPSFLLSVQEKGEYFVTSDIRDRKDGIISTIEKLGLRMVKVPGNFLLYLATTHMKLAGS